MQGAMMGRALFAALLLLIFGAVIYAPTAPTVVKAIECTKAGTDERDLLSGTRGRDVLCGLQGNDFLTGKAGNDKLSGGKGRDTEVGGGGSDTLLGGDGRDRLYSVDGHAGDILRGGPGVDNCHGDVGDGMAGCEREFRGLSAATVTAMSGSLEASVAVGEQYQDCFAADPSCNMEGQ